jgi:hypothetical protein
MKEQLIQLCQEQITITKYKRQFDVHIFYFFPLVELDCIFIFMNGLDDHIKYMVKIYGTSFKLTSTRTLPNTFLLLTIQLKKYIHEIVFDIHV